MITPQKIQEAKKLLEEAGFFTDNLWSVDDVRGMFDVDDDKAMEILYGAFANDATYNQIWLSIQVEGQEKHNLKKIGEWICTDPDTDQWGKYEGNRQYLFKEDCEFDDTGKVSALIDLNGYTEEEINDHLSSYGWTVEGLKEDNPNLASAEWIMAECIFEQTITDYIN